MYQFNSQIQLGSHLFSFSENQIKNEPMLFSCSLDAAYDLGGPLTHDFLDNLVFNYSSPWYGEKDLIIDSRVHMSFKPGIYFAIPGFHLDDVPRDTNNGQPNHKEPTYKAEHCMAMVGGDIAPTRFALGKVELPEIKNGEVYYKVWHPLVEEQLKNGTLQEVYAPDRQLVFFDWQTFHEGTPTRSSGWRFFIRASRRTNRERLNEIRRQVQVYLPEPFCGW